MANVVVSELLCMSPQRIALACRVVDADETQPQSERICGGLGCCPPILRGGLLVPAEVFETEALVYPVADVRLAVGICGKRAFGGTERFKSRGEVAAVEVNVGDLPDGFTVALPMRRDELTRGVGRRVGQQSFVLLDGGFVIALIAERVGEAAHRDRPGAGAEEIVADASPVGDRLPGSAEGAGE